MTLKPCKHNEHGFHNFMVVEWEYNWGASSVNEPHPDKKTAKICKCRHCLLTSEEVGNE